MTPEQEKRMEELEVQIEVMQNILFDNGSDVRFISNTRKAVVVGQHTAGKPTIIDNMGRRYNLQTV